MTIVKTTALITINETLWIQLVLFLLFLFVINRVMFRPVRRNLAARERHFESLREDLRGLGSRLEALEEELAAEDRRMREEARRMRHALRSEGELEAEALLGKARGDIDRIRAETESELAAGIAAARLRIVEEQGVLANAIVEAVLERRSRG